MPARVEGIIYAEVDVRDYGSDLEIVADMEDIEEIMDANNIEAGEMIEYLRDGAYQLKEQEVLNWLEHESVFTLTVIVKKCLYLIETEYDEAEQGRVEYCNRLASLEADPRLSTAGSVMHN